MRPASVTQRPGVGTRICVPEILLWCTLAMLSLAGHLFITHGPVLRNDSYQYLSVAENFLAGRPGQTSIVYFDSERSAGRIPAPLTTLPAGFSLVTSAVAATGLPLKHCALAVSLSAVALLIPAVVYAAGMLGIGSFVTRVLLIWLIGNSWVAIYGSSVTAESLYTLISFAALILLADGMMRTQAGAPRWWPLLIGSLLVGLSYWVRYAGLFVFASAGAFFAVRSVILRDRISRNATLALGVAAALIGAGLLRNELLVGSWKGGNDKVVHHSVVVVLRNFLVWAHHLLLGGVAAARFSGFEVLLVAGALVAGGAITAAGLKARDQHAHRPWCERLGPGALLLSYLAVYCAGMIYLGITSVISFDTRMLYPVLPIVLLLLARLLQPGEPVPQPGSAARTAFVVGLSAATIGYLGIHARSYLAPLGPAPDEIVARELSSLVSPGVTLHAWIDSNIPVDEAVVSNQGQPSGYVLHRKTVALVAREYSDQRWDEAAIRSLLRTYDAHFLILYGGDAGDDVLRYSPFLAALLHGSIPDWLSLAAHSGGVSVYRVIT